MHLKIMVLESGGWEQRKFHHLKAYVTKMSTNANQSHKQQ
jgi:hypothetical protein